MDGRDDERIRAYLLRRMSEEDQTAFEARLLDEPELLSAVQRAERSFLATGVAQAGTLRWVCAKCFLGGALVGMLLAGLASRLLAS